jgi:hypothetical protein
VSVRLQAFGFRRLRLEGRGFGSHMLDFQAEPWRGTALTFDAPEYTETPLAHDAEVSRLHRAWVWLTTGAGIIATAVAISTIVSIVLAWTFVSGLHYRDRAEEGRAVLQRILELTALQTGSQSALGCLDVGRGDPLVEMCERTIFANPQTVASANAFVVARLSVLGDALASASEAHSPSAGAVATLRQALQNDPFGIVAHVLAARYGCSPSQCSAFAMLVDTTEVVANLNARTFENLVGRYESSWQAGPTVSVLPGQGPAVAAVSSLPGQGPPVVAPVPGALLNLRSAPAGGSLKGLYVPPASSIPAVSIMTDEPRAPPAQTGSAPTASGSTQRPQASPRSTSRGQSATPVAPPIQLSPNPGNPG